MAEIVNLRRARKAKARKAGEEEAAGNRAQHGVSKEIRALNKTRAEKDAGKLSGHRLGDKN